MPRTAIAIILVHLFASEYAAQAAEGCPWHCDSGRKMDANTVSYRMPCDPARAGVCGASMRCLSDCGLVYKENDLSREDMDLKLALLPIVLLLIVMACFCVCCKHACGKLAKKLRTLPSWFEDESGRKPEEKDPESLERGDVYTSEELPPNFRELFEKAETATASTGTSPWASPYPSPGPSSVAPSTATSANVSEHDSEQGADEQAMDSSGGSKAMDRSGSSPGSKRGRAHRSRSEGAPRRPRLRDVPEERGDRPRPKSARSGETSSSRSRSQIR